jgi:rubrerythrin
MFSSKQYRAKATEYAERGNKTEAPNEIGEYRDLARTFAEMADNEKWVEDNYEKLLHGPGKDENDSDTLGVEERILRCLGAALIMQWTNLPKKLQKELFDAAGAMDDLLNTEALRARIARFLHTHKDDRRNERHS